jgi:Methyltransferase domain
MTYETDKEVLGFVPDYQRIAGILGPAARVLEIGVLNGLGLAMLQDMYPQGLVAGVDFNPASHWPAGTVRIVAGQSDPALPTLLGEHAPTWDLIVDDASHKGHLTAATFELLWPLVAPGGFYVIEDWFIGSPLWPSTGCWGGAPPGSQAVADSYDPELLRVVQDLVLLLDKPYPGAGALGPLRDGKAESVLFRYGMAIVRKTA